MARIKFETINPNDFKPINIVDQTTSDYDPEKDNEETRVFLQEMFKKAEEKRKKEREQRKKLNEERNWWMSKLNESERLRLSLCPKWEDKKAYIDYWNNPMFFLKNEFNWISQRIFPKYEEKLWRARRSLDYHKLKLDMFRPIIWGKNIFQITWQEVEILYHYKNALQNRGPKTLVFCSWNGIGKSWITAFIMLHFAVCFYAAKVVYIAPDNDLVIAEKNLVKTIFNSSFKYSSSIKEKINTIHYWWDSYGSYIKFTSSKKWLQWIHAENFLIVADESSDLNDDILKSVNWLLWRGNNIFIMLWNPKSDKWYFHDICCSNSEHIATLHFNAEQSPLIDREYIQKAKDLYWEHSDEYIRRIKWWYPK